MDKIVLTKYGMVEGICHEDYYEYRGIPFAKPPVGERRWQEPEACEPWEGVYQADRFQAKSMQDDCSDMPLYGKEFYQTPGFDRENAEDCLYLNIWVPKDAVPGQCPVAVWIHGGAFQQGFPSEVEFDGAEYSRRNVILVTIAYRLGVFGFLSIPELVKRDGHSGNYGLMDQIMALRWVQENIRQFGGNPDNVTLFGQSAGAISTLCLCNSRRAKGLFHKAIMQSGAGYPVPLDIMQEQAQIHQLYENLKAALGITSFEELKDLPAEEIHSAYAGLEMVKNGRFLSPCVDGYVLDKDLNESMLNGEMFDLPYMLGSTKDDILRTEGKADEPSGGLWDCALSLAGLCHKKGKQVPYLYYFAHDLPGDQAGAFHSSELWYVFGTLGRCWRPMTEEDRRLSGEMLDAWCFFMSNGSPNCENGDEEWQPCTKGQYRLFR